MARTFDPFDAEQVAGAPWPLLEELRREGPVASIGDGMRLRHPRTRSAAQSCRDTTSFSNASGMKAPGVVIPFEDRILGELDPPEHSLVRRVMVTALTPTVVHEAEPFMRAAADTLLDALRGRGGRGPRRRVHGAVAEPGDRAPARVPRRRRRPRRPDGEGAHGERIPAAEPH